MDFLLVSSNLIDSGTFFQVLAADDPMLASAFEVVSAGATSVLTRVLT